eukprot:8398185-Karenia_brevis.AAC.1
MGVICRVSSQCCASKVCGHLCSLFTVSAIRKKEDCFQGCSRKCLRSEQSSASRGYSDRASIAQSSTPSEICFAWLVHGGLLVSNLDPQECGERAAESSSTGSGTAVPLWVHYSAASHISS